MRGSGAAWRLLVHPSAPGPWNMGVDEALLASARRGIASVRFYKWQGPWLSLGYAQRIGTERLRALRAGGVGWVRRFTGGRGVLHGADLTYSIAAPEGQLPPTVRASYRLVADALLVAMASLGVSATRNAPAPGVAAATGFDCFDSAAADEICIAGRKLSGSAQRRVAGAVLQHGSIRLAPDPPVAASAVATGSARRSAPSCASGTSTRRSTTSPRCGCWEPSGSPSIPRPGCGTTG